MAESSNGEIDHFITIFQNAPSLEEKLQLFCERNDVKSFIQEHLVINPSSKCSTEAERLKDEGNKMFVGGRFKQSLEKYNEALVLVDQNHVSAGFSLILANRSAVFFKLKQFQHCLDDINIALESNYPAQLRYKLYDRRTRCFYFLGLKENFLENLRLMEKLKGDETGAGGKVEKMIDELKQLDIENLSSKKTSRITKCKTRCEKVNSNFAGFSSSVEMCQSQERGRFMIAREDIPAGAVIGAEDPVASSLSPDKRSLFCSLCFCRAEQYFLPCPGCCEVRFCSPQCWRSGSSGSHRLECGLNTDLAAILGEVKGGAAPPQYYRLCLEMIGARTVEEVLEVNINQSVDMCTVPHQKEGQLESLLRLVSVDDQRSLETDFWIFLTVSFFVALLEQKNFFTDSKLLLDDQVNRQNNNFTPQKLKVGAFLTRILRILQFNVHTVMQAVIKDQTFSMESMGSALYASIAFLNHSCNPNTIKYWEGDRMVLVASQPIRQGEEVSDNYGMHFLTSSRAVRRNWLEEYYWFHCKCPACEDDYPRREKLSDTVSKVFCSKTCRTAMKLVGSDWSCDCGERRSSSEVKTSLSRQVKRSLETARTESMMSEDVGGALQSYCDILEQMYSLTSHPWAGLVMPEQMLWKAVRTLRGNKSIE